MTSLHSRWMHAKRSRIADILTVLVCAFSSAQAAVPVDYVQQTKAPLSQAGGVAYICQTQHQSHLQNINPDYLVPGCRLSAGRQDNSDSSMEYRKGTDHAVK